MRAIVRLLRPKQWPKNLLVFAAPGAGGFLGEPATFGAAAVAFVAFCLAASGAYCLNDAADVHADRRHPTKRLRPVASGEVTVAVARALGLALILAGLLLGLLVGWLLATAVLSYLLVTSSYTIWFKHMAVFDIAAVAAGFVLRTLGGAAATGVTVSDWFLIVACFGALFVVAGKRSAELADGGIDAASRRSVLADYPRAFLFYVQAVASGVTLLAYCLWAFEKAELAGGSIPWYELSIVPFVIALLRYALRVYSGHGGAPEDVLLGDRSIQVLGLIWVALFAAAVYA